MAGVASVAKRTVSSQTPKIFLCEWFVKLVRPGKDIPKNNVQCHVPMKMTKFDIKNYFQRIYGLDVYKVHTRIQQGKVKTIRNTDIKYKRPDFKVAYLVLANDEFEFPDLFSKYKSDPHQP